MPPPNQTGRLVYMPEPGRVELRNYDVPSPEPDAIVARVIQANVCGSELHIYGGHHPEVTTGVLGHEVVCEILELGDNVTTDYAGRPVQPGDRIAPAYFQTCRHCPACLQGEFNLCENAYQHWVKPPDDPPHFHGTFGTHYYVTPNQYFFTVPDAVDSRIAAAANCALSQVLYGLDLADAGYGDTVLIQGAGGLGLNCTAAAAERGATPLVIDAVDTRLERARAFGAAHTIDLREHDTVEARADHVRELTGGRGADVVVEVAGVPEAFAESLHHVRPGGHIVEMGNVNPGHTTPFDPGLLTRKTVRITAAVRYQPWYLERALRFLAAHATDYPYDDLVDATFALDDVTTALEQSADRTVTRAGLRPHDPT